MTGYTRDDVTRDYIVVSTRVEDMFPGGVGELGEGDHVSGDRGSWAGFRVTYLVQISSESSARHAGNTRAGLPEALVTLYQYLSSGREVLGGHLTVPDLPVVREPTVLRLARGQRDGGEGTVSYTDYGRGL